MHNRVKLFIVLWICALCVSACGAFEIGIEHLPTGSNAGSNPGEVDWQATAVTLQTEATSIASDVTQTTGLLAAAPEPTLVPTVIAPASEQAMVAYVQGGDIWVKTIPDGEAQRLTQDGRNQEPRWSASGEWLTFVKNSDFPVLWAMRADGSEAQEVGTSSGAQSYAWSPVEDKIATGVGGSIHLFEFVKGSPASLITQIDLGAQDGNAMAGEIAWSPDGQQIAFTWRGLTSADNSSDGSNANNGLWLVNVNGDALTQLVASNIPEQGDIILHGWSGDGEYVIYWQAPILSAAIFADGVPLYRVPVQGGTPQVIADTVLLHEDFVQSQPNGLTQVAVVVGSGRETWQNKRLRSYIVSGMQHWEMSPTDQAVSSPAWSPAGDAIAYIGAPNAEGVVGGPEAQAALNLRQLWLALPNEPEPQLITRGMSYREEAPQWIDDNTLLFVRMNMDGQVSLWTISKTGDDEQMIVEEMTPAPEWFGYYGHIDWSPLFALWRPITKAQAEMEMARTMELTPAVVPPQPAASNGRTLVTFLEGLHPMLTREKAVALWGEPDVVTGSGLIIYQFRLDDGMTLWLAFPGAEPLSYAQLELPSGRRFALMPLDESAVAEPAVAPMTPTPTPAAVDMVTATSTPLPTVVPPGDSADQAIDTPTPEFSPTPTAASEATATPLPPTIMPLPTGTPLVTPAASSEAAGSTVLSPTVQAPEVAPVGAQQSPAPAGGWTATVDTQTGGLTLESPDGQTQSVFETGNRIDWVGWSPDGTTLLAMQTHLRRDQSDSTMNYADKPLELWQIQVSEDGVEPPQQIFQSPTESTEDGYIPELIRFGPWSPDGRYLPFWAGVAGSMGNDGLPLWIADIKTGRTSALAEVALVNPRYQSWSPDSSHLAFVAGGYRSAQVNKWLNLYNVATEQVTTVVSDTEQVPGIVAWSPTGEWIAYAAVPAEETGDEWADWMVLENPAITGRRIYLLDPATNEFRRLNDDNAFQDAPVWSDDGSILTYVQRNGDELVLMAFEIATGEATVVEDSRRPLPEIVGFYGQSNWEGLYPSRP